MSYQSALKAAGATVIDTLYAGDYQGTWGSIVEYQGKRGLVVGYYGSCSFCDAFQGEFDSYEWRLPTEKDGKYIDDYGDEITKEQYDAEYEAYNKKLAEFGMSYLKVIQDRWDVENQLANINGEDDWRDEENYRLLTWALERL